MIERFELNGIRAIEPLGFLEFLQLEAGADGLGRGGREEACILGVSCDGFIITAYKTSTIRKLIGREIIWTKQN